MNTHLFSPREPGINHLLDNRRQWKPYNLNPEKFYKLRLSPVF